MTPERALGFSSVPEVPGPSRLAARTRPRAARAGSRLAGDLSISNLCTNVQALGGGIGRSSAWVPNRVVLASLVGGARSLLASARSGGRAGLAAPDRAIVPDISGYLLDIPAGETGIEETILGATARISRSGSADSTAPP